MKVFGKEILSIVEMRSKHCSFYSLKFQPMDFSFFFFFQLFGYQICVSDTNPFFLKEFFFLDCYNIFCLGGFASTLGFAIIHSPHCSQSILDTVALSHMVAINPM